MGVVSVPASECTTNLSVTAGANDFTIASSDGTDAVVGKATTSKCRCYGFRSRYGALTQPQLKVSRTESNIKSILSALEKLLPQRLVIQVMIVP